jgi:hypothetical protein
MFAARELEKMIYWALFAGRLAKFIIEHASATILTVCTTSS